MKIMSKEQIKTSQQIEDLSPYRLALGLVKPKSNVISAGCGAGREVKFLREVLNCNVIALDNNSHMLKRSQKTNPGVLHLRLDISNTILVKKVDYIVCLWNTINFLTKEQRKEFVGLSYRNLNDGGKLIITSQDLKSKWRAPFFNLKVHKMYYYPASEINYWFRDTKFKISKIMIDNTWLIVAEKT